MKKLQNDNQNFEDIIVNNLLYIDKTKYIYELLTGGGHYYFLAHPRRFGKSLLISTLECIFQGKKELFNDLWISTSDYTWPVHPVIVLNFAKIAHNTPEEFKQDLISRLFKIAQDNNINNILGTSLSSIFEDLVNELTKKHGRVVLLIDEYDKPILDHITNIPFANANIAIISDLMSTVKNLNNIAFVFVTGISRFAKTAVFTGDHLVDIIKKESYNGLLGITDKEIDSHLEPYIKSLAQKQQLSYDAARINIRTWYNGYQFSEQPLKVYNPFSVLRCLDNTKFDNYWFTSGSPSYLIKLIKKNNYTFDDKSISELDNLIVSKDVFDTYSLDRLPIIAVLLQAGYLTIKEYKRVPIVPLELLSPEDRSNYDNWRDEFVLGFPNKELRDSFSMLFLQDVIGIDQKIENTAITDFF